MSNEAKRTWRRQATSSCRYRRRLQERHATASADNRAMSRHCFTPRFALSDAMLEAIVRMRKMSFAISWRRCCEISLRYESAAARRRRHACFEFGKIMAMDREKR